MRTKRFVIGMLAGGLTLVMISSTAWAGNVQRNRWEGVALGVAATLLGQALLDHHRVVHYGSATVPRTVGPSRGHHDDRSPAIGHRSPKHSGKRHYQKVWVPPVYKRVWNPGHYNHRGRWLPGHWTQTQIQPGHWRRKPVWSANRHRPHRPSRP